MSRRALAAMGLIALAGAAACKGKSAVSVKRTRTAPAVEYVPAPVTSPAVGTPGSTDSASTAAVGTLAVAGTRRPELEPNNDGKTAQLVTVDTVIAGELADGSDVDLYALSIEKNSELHLLLASAGDVVLELRNPAGVVVARSDRGGNGVTEGLPNIAVVKGRYLIAVTAFRKAVPAAKKSTKPSQKPGPAQDGTGSASATTAAPVRYELQVAAGGGLPRSGIELEPNVDPGSANDVFIGEAASGYIGWTGDVDVWKLSVEGLAARSALDLDVSAVDGVTPTLTVSDAVGRPLLKRQGEKSRELSIRSLVPVLGTNVPPYYFLAVSGERSNPLVTYRLNVVARVLSSNDEAEPNDTNATAQPLLFGQPLQASWQIGDVDNFAIAPEATSRRLTLVITPTQGADLVGEVVMPDQPVIQFNHRGQGGSEAVDVDVPAGVAATVRVQGNLKRKAVEGAYEISVDVAPRDGDPMPNEQRAP